MNTPSSCKSRKSCCLRRASQRVKIPKDRLSKQTSGSDLQILVTFVPPAYLPCTKAFNELEKINVKKLQLEIQNRGRYLLLKCLTTPNRMNAIVAAMEDEDGECVLLQLYGREEDSVRPATEILNKGMVMTVKEPYFKISSDRGYGLRVDHASDIPGLVSPMTAFPSSGDHVSWSWTNPEQKWKDEGNHAMNEKKY